MDRTRDRTLAVIALLATLAFGWILLPYFSAILWAVIAAIIFAPVNARLLRAMPGRRNTAAGLTLLILLATGIIPAILLGLALIGEVTTLYERFQSETIDLGGIFASIQHALPGWANEMLARLDLADFDAAREQINAGLASSLHLLAAQTVDFSQRAFGFVVGLSVMLYLSFFLLRDGKALGQRIDVAIPLRAEQRHVLIEKFINVIQATIKGGLIVALLQGLVGGIVFWCLGIHAALLWGVAMGIFSLLPAVGTGIIWVPVALYLLVTGSVWQGVVLVFCGLFVIGMIDNLLRPILVGRNARLPDYVVLITTLGGLELFGFNGLVIGPVIAALFIAVWQIIGNKPSAPEADAGMDIH